MTRVAIVGAGYFGRFHLDAWARMPDAELAALCVPDPEAARAVAAGFAIPAVHARLADLIAAEQPDLLDITSPPDTHLAMIRDAAGRVPWIICQKPFCRGRAEATEAAALAAARGSRLAIHENFRFQPWYRAIAHDLTRIGAPFHVAFRLRPGDGQGPEAYLARQPYFRTMPRFLVRETAIHFTDTFRFLMGEVTAVTAHLQRRNPAIAGEDSALVLYEFASGATGLLDANRLAGHEAANPRLTLGELDLEGAAGTFRLDGHARLTFRAHGAAAAEPVPYAWEDRNFGGDCVHLTSRALLAAFREGRPAETEAGAYLRNIEIEDAIYQSAATGRRVALPPPGEPP